MSTTIKTIAFIVVTSFVFMGGCLSKLTSVNFDYPTQGVVMTDDQPMAGPHTLGETVVTSDLKKQLENNGTSLDLLDELKLRTAKITIEDDSLGNFDKIDKAEIWLSADQQPEVLIASKTVGKGLHEISLDVNTNENLANYLKAATFTYRIKGTNNTALPPMHLKIDAVWIVKASSK